MRVAIVARFFDPAYLAGGPVQTLAAMIRNAPDGHNVDVLSSNRDHGTRRPLEVPVDSWAKWGGAEVFYASSLAATWRGLREIRHRRPDVVYINSLFDLQFSVLPQCLARLRVFPGAQVLVAPRGELSPGAVAIKARKKRAFLAAFRALGFSRQVIWHASTSMEATDIRAHFGATARILVRQNDTVLPDVAWKRSARSPGSCRFLFASRLSRKKRVDLLLRALSEVTADFQLTVVGAFDEPEYESACRRLADSPRLRGRVQFLGQRTREDVLGEMRNADALLFPTAGENFGHIVAEALSAACPAFVSDHTPWSEVLRTGGGHVVMADTPEAWAKAVGDFVALGPQGWERASQKAASAYGSWAKLSKGPHLFEMLARLPV